MRVIGLDYGDKTIGVAMSDPLGIIACGLETIRRQDAASLRKSLRRIAEIVKEYDADTLILGFPRNMDGTEGPRCKETIAFKDRLERNIKRVTIVLWDERLSTVASLRSLRESGVSSGKINQVVDTIAAVYILQGYLDSLRR